VKGRLQPTRALGDYHLKFGHLYKGKGKFNGPYIQCTPDVKVFDITDNLQTIVVASDGVWDFVSKDIVAEASL
jgi:serine/threonine protein phosphatase PrpC